ncbi:MAG: phosphoglycerate dehydrogenase, partial [Burkholderiaceae bacterium]|nr:phosphoglycerate dehydrogenase [Burkholderiaceae bacterium]
MSPTSLDKSKIRFLLLEGLHPSALQVLQAAGYSQIESLPGALPQEELIERIADAHFIGIRSRTQLNAEVLAHAHKLVA